MTARLAAIVRHPIKAVGRESLEAVALAAGRRLPADRVWAVAHAGARLAPGEWAAKMNFLRGVAAPALMAVAARLDEAAGRVTLSHPGAATITLDPDDAADAARLLAWLAPFWPDSRPAPAAVVRAGWAAFTDVPEPWVSVLGMASNRALGARLGRTLSIHRWRGNLWLEGLAPWEEFDLVGRRFRIGAALLEGRQRITRCEATAADPDSGRRDLDTLGALQSGCGHTDFGIYAEVIAGGTVRLGDPVAAEG
ncbi:MAG: MOSC domain-containing protein [Rhodobacteraceae bacterium]|nr:MOSC domain-containing protein [Paracoccaceae bacterium]